MVFQVCPLHAFEEVDGINISEEVGWEFTCPRQDHIPPGPYTWLSVPPPAPGTELTGIAADFGLHVELPLALSHFTGTWVEYGVLEREYALHNPNDWERLVERYGHTAIGAKRYTVSAFLASTLGHLQRQGAVDLHMGPATGRWDYNRQTSWWSLQPQPEWESRLSWEDSGFTVEYVPGQTEV